MRDFYRTVGLPARRTGWGIGLLLLVGVASVAVCGPAQASLTITPSFGPGVTATAQAAFDFAAGEYESLFNQHNNVNVNIQVNAGTTGLGSSSTPILGILTYSRVRTDLITEYAAAPSAARTTASGSGGSIFTTTDPSTTGRYFIARSEAKALGLIANDAANDGTFTYNSTLSYTFDPNNRQVAGEFDFIGVAEHEISEIMGRIPGLGGNIGGSAGFLPYDLFRYTGNNTRGITNTGGGNYFSIDNGATNLHGYNNANLNGGNPQDWDASVLSDPYDAFTGTNQGHSISAVDIELVNVLGWDLAAVPEPPIGLPLLGLGAVLLGAKIMGWNKKKGALRLASADSLLYSMTPSHLGCRAITSSSSNAERATICATSVPWNNPQRLACGRSFRH